MSYLGNSPTDQSFVATVDYFNGDGVTVAFTLSRQVASVAQVQAVIENVPQNPSSAFTLMGNVITFTSAPPSGSANIYVYYTSPNTKVIAPSAGTVDTTALAAAAVTPVKMANYGAELGMRNRVINGDMRIDQRNNGTAVTINAAAYTYPVDRWGAYGQATDGVYTAQRSSTAPAGFNNSLLATVTTADASIAPSQFYIYKHGIEGFNVGDLNWGSSNAATVTLSFWVRSSLTGMFSGSITNGSYTRSYPFSYTINSANTWEQKTIIIAGDTTGTWLTDNNAGMYLYIDLGSGSGNKGTAGAWSSTGYTGATGSVNLIGTLGATFYITGVQLEKGTVATPFEYRTYSTELALCQRYYEISGIYGVSGGAALAGGAGNATNRAFAFAGNDFKVTKRTTPTVTIQSAQTGTANNISGYSSGTNYVVNDISIPTPNVVCRYLQITTTFTGYEPQSYYWQASAEL